MTHVELPILDTLSAIKIFRTRTVHNYDDELIDGSKGFLEEKNSRKDEIFRWILDSTNINDLTNHR